MLHARSLTLPVIGTCLLLAILASSRTKVVAEDFACDVPKSIPLKVIPPVKLKISMNNDKITFTYDSLNRNVKADGLEIIFDGSFDAEGKPGNSTPTPFNEQYTASISGSMEYNEAWPDAAGLLEVPVIKKCNAIAKLTRTNGSLAPDLRGKVMEAVSEAAVSCIKQDICAKMFWDIAKAIVKKKISKDKKVIIPKVTEWLFKTIAEKMAYVDRTFSLTLPAPNKHDITDFFSLQHLNASVYFTSGQFDVTTSLVNKCTASDCPFKKPDKLTYDFDMALIASKTSIFYDDWEFKAPNISYKGPVKFEVEDVGILAQFTASWTSKPASIKLTKLEVTPSKAESYDFPLLSGLTEHEIEELRGRVKTVVREFLMDNLRRSIKSGLTDLFSRTDLEPFRPALDGTLDLK